MSKKHRQSKHQPRVGAGIVSWLSASPMRPPDAAWRYLWVLLAAAFFARAGVALSGDFVIHPDEIMQYLEPAHRLVFDAGVSYWEYYFGARSWLAPGFVAAILELCRILGLDSPSFYIGAVKLTFCLVSLLIPFGMYVVGRNLFGEAVGRVALLLGAFWYELVGFAHKPMTEFIATALLFALLAVVIRPTRPSLRRSAFAAALGVLLVAMRFHYAPLAALVLLTEFLRADSGRVRVGMIAATALMVAAVGFFEYVAWGGFFHSYWINLKVNLYLGAGRAGESTPWHFPAWLTLASGGVFWAAMAGGALGFWRRRFPALLLLALLAPHMMQEHKEYRFIFAAIPLWLLLFADVLVAGLAALKNSKKWIPPAGLGYAGVVSLFGMANLLPFQNWIYVAHSQETGRVNFIRGQDPTFAAYRHLAADASARGVYDIRRPYFNTGGYYYLHHKIPFYQFYHQFEGNDIASHVSHIIANKAVETDGGVVAGAGRMVIGIKADESAAVEHLVLPQVVNDRSLGKLVYWDKTGKPTPLDDFSQSAEFGDITIWSQKDDSRVARQWEEYQVYPDNEAMYPVVYGAVGDDARKPLPNMGIRYAE